MGLFSDHPAAFLEMHVRQPPRYLFKWNSPNGRFGKIDQMDIELNEIPMGEKQGEICVPCIENRGKGSTFNVGNF